MNILSTGFTLALSVSTLVAADKPNILWITCEDTSADWFGCYGNAEAQTPRIDGMAKNSLLFANAYSNSPVCAVARSTILNGAYAVTMGTHHMRSRHSIPPKYKPYVHYLKEAGYYCTNNSKTDYNFKGDDKAIWDESSNDAHYRNRQDGQPFFAIFNIFVSHESSLFPEKIARHREAGIIPETPRIDPSEVRVPPYLPDLPEIRSDIAIYYDNITALDRQVGKVLDDLDKAGLADDTIVFFYGDHGGILPRGKRYLNETGTHIPMIVHVPEKWADLSPFLPGSTVEETVAFVDLAPTLLSLIGMERPPQMQGRPFLGDHRRDPHPDEVEFLFADRFDEIYGMRRGLVNTRWKYLRCFTPHRPGAPYSFYQFRQDGWKGLRKAWKNNALAPQFAQLWETPQPVEHLYDLTQDPWEIHNLADDPAYEEPLSKLRNQLQLVMTNTADVGIIPEPMFSPLAKEQPIADYWMSRQADHSSLVDLAFLASSASAMDLPLLLKQIESQDPLARYWATQGCLILGTSAAPAKEELIKRLDDTYSAIRVAAAHALVRVGEDQYQPRIAAELEKDISDAAKLNALNTLMELSAFDDIPESWLKSTLNEKNRGSYLYRSAVRMQELEK